MFRRPLEGLGDVTGSSDSAEGRVGIRRSDVAGRSEDFADVFREVVAVGEPRAVFLNRERTRRRRLRRIPSRQPQVRLPGARHIDRRDLKIPAIDVAVMQRNRSRDRYFLEVAPTLRVVAAVDCRIAFFITETHRAVRAVVSDLPRSREGLNQSRVSVGVIFGSECVLCVPVSVAEFLLPMLSKAYA